MELLIVLAIVVPNLIGYLGRGKQRAYKEEAIMEIREEMEKLKKELKEQGINVSEDAIFLATFLGKEIKGLDNEIEGARENIRGEIRDSRNILMGVLFGLFAIVIGLITAFGRF